METKSLKSNFIWNTIGSFTYLFCQWLLTFLVIRLSSDLKDVGNLSLAITITNIFYGVACFNMRPYLVSDNINEYKVEDYTTFRLITIVFSVIACFIYSLFFKYNTSQLVCIMLYMVYKVGEAVVDLLHAFEQRKSRMDIGGISLLIRGILSILFFIIGMKLFNSVNYSILLMIIVTFIFIIIYDYKKVQKFEILRINFKSKKVKELFFKFLPLAIGTFLSTMSASWPRQLLEKIYSSETLGIYATIATPAVIVQVCATYIYNPLLVSFSNYKKNIDYKGFKGMLIKSLIVILILSLVCYVGSLLFAEPVLRILYGTKISKYYKLFSLIIIYTSLTGISLFFHNILIILRKINILSFIYFTGFAICVLTSDFIIKKYGMNGVSYTLLLFTIFIVIEMFIVIYKYMRKMKKIERN